MERIVGLSCTIERCRLDSAVKRWVLLLALCAAVAIAYAGAPAIVLRRVSTLFALDHEIPVEVRKAQKTLPAVILTAGGQLEPVREFRAVATVPGRVEEIRYKTGDKVAAGSVVAIIAAGDGDLGGRLVAQDASVQDAEARLKSSDAELVAAEKRLVGLRDLYGRNLIARRDVEQAETEVKTAYAQRAAAGAEVAQRISISKQTRRVLEVTRVIAPAAGVITRRWSEPGAAVAESAPILSIAPTSPLLIMLRMKRHEAEKLAPGTKATIGATDNSAETFQGFVTQVHELANFDGDEVSVDVEVANPRGVLKFGSTANVSFMLAEPRDGIFVPEAALVHDHGVSGVYICEGGTARWRNIVAGKNLDGEIEVISGLRPGDLVVIKGAQRLSDGTRVRTTEHHYGRAPTEKQQVLRSESSSLRCALTDIGLEAHNGKPCCATS
jgi:HlyD family secretion protein